MFDAPVLDVTASSTPTLIAGIRQTNQTTLQTFPFALAWLNALPRFPQATRLPSPAAVENNQVNVAQTKALLPNEAFQLLQPLNLADATQALDKVFERPLQDIPSQLPNSGQFLTSTSAPLQQPTAANIQAVVEPPSAITSQVPPAIAQPEKLLPVVPREALRQCIDVPYEETQGTTKLQVLLRGSLIGEINTTDGTESAASSLQNLLSDEPINPDEITPLLEGDQPAIRLSNDVIVHVLAQETNEEIAVIDDKSKLRKGWAAIAWSDQLRQEMGAMPLDAGNIQVMLKALKPSKQQLNGIASWYGPYFHGRQTANGETFDQNTLTAAHKSLPFNTVLQVRNLENNRTVVVRINDRGPYIGKRSLDLSKAAAQCLDSEQTGVIPYEAFILEPEVVNSPTAE